MLSDTAACDTLRFVERKISICLALAALAIPCARAQDRALTGLPYTPSLEPAFIDKQVDPCEDFFRYACGNWIKTNPIPADQPRWDVYGKLQNDNQRFLWGILEAAAASKQSAARTASEQKIGDFFGACMDEAAVEKTGAAPLRKRLDEIAALKSAADLPALLGKLHLQSADTSPLFGFGSAQDFADSSRVIAFASSSGLGLPDRDYYVKDDAKSKATRARYLAHVAKMFELLGASAAAAQDDAAIVVRIETALAKASLTRVEQRDPYKIFHRQTLAALQKLAPSFDWPAYFSAVGLNPQPWLNVAQPAFIKELNARLEGENLSDLKTYLRWALIDASASYLSKSFVDEDFAFYSAYLRGVQADQPR